MSKGWHGGASSPAFVGQSWSDVSVPFGELFLLSDFETREELYYPDVPLLWQEQQEEAQADNDDGDDSDTVEDNFTRVVINNCVGHWTGVITRDKALGQYPLPSPVPGSEGWAGWAGECSAWLVQHGAGHSAGGSGQQGAQGTNGNTACSWGLRQPLICHQHCVGVKRHLTTTVCQH